MADVEEKEFEIEEVEDSDDEDLDFGRPKDVSSGALDNPDEFAEDDPFGMVDASTAEFMAVKPWKGSIVAPTAAPKNVASPPDTDLTLEWAYGYRSFDCRNNVYFNSSGRVVYPCAGLVVVYDEKTHTQEHFRGHNDDVICLAQNPSNPDIFASGQCATIVGRRGTPPHICIWDSKDVSTPLLTIKKAGRKAIRTLGFSIDGKYLASVGDDGNHSVAVWDARTGAKIAEEKGDTNKIYHLVWSHKTPNEFFTVGARHAYYWTITSSGLKKKRASTGKFGLQTFYSVAYSKKGYPCAGARDGRVYVFVGGKAKVARKIAKGKIFTLSSWAEGLVAGASDRKVTILNSKLKPQASFEFPHKVRAVSVQGDSVAVGTAGAEVFRMGLEESKVGEPVVSGHHDGELWGIATHPAGGFFMSAGEDNLLRKYDIDSRKLIGEAPISTKRAKRRARNRASTLSKYPVNQCARAIAISPDGTEACVGTNDGCISVYNTSDLSHVVTRDINSFGKRKVRNQSGNWISAMSFSPSGRTVAVGTHGQVVCLLDATDGYRCKGALKAHHSFISHLDWSKDGTAIRTNSGDYELLYHSIDEKDLKSSAQDTSASRYADTEWATENCIFGWAVQGIFDTRQDGTDVNSVDVNPSKSLIATGDDFGFVNLFRYPCAKEGNEAAKFGGHSSHVARVRFSVDGERLFTAGGYDKAVLQWRVGA